MCAAEPGRAQVVRYQNAVYTGRWQLMDHVNAWVLITHLYPVLYVTKSVYPSVRARCIVTIRLLVQIMVNAQHRVNACAVKALVVGTVQYL